MTEWNQFKYLCCTLYSYSRQLFLNMSSSTHKMSLRNFWNSPGIDLRKIGRIPWPETELTIHRDNWGEGLIGRLKVKSSQSLLCEKVVPFLYGFPITWLFKRDFRQQKMYSQRKVIYGRLKKKEDLRLKLNQCFEGQLDKLIYRHQKQRTHLPGLDFFYFI